MKTILGIVIVAVLAVGAYYVWGVTTGGTDSSTGQYAQTFQEKLFTRATEKSGGLIPIEGYDADLLMNAIAGFEPVDFDGVETFEGHYELSGNTLQYVRDQASPVSSAERTISTEGYGTLLDNVTERLGVSVTDESSLDSLIDTLDVTQTERIETRIDQGATTLGFKIVPLEVLEDSRCPTDVQCIQAGTVRLRAEVIQVSTTTPIAQEFKLGEPVQFNDTAITLVKVNPESISTEEIEDNDYKFIFEIVQQ